MGFGIACDLVTRTGSQGETPPVLQLGYQFAFQNIQDMSAEAPVIGQVTRTVFDHSDPDVSYLDGLPMGDSSLSRMLRCR